MADSPAPGTPDATVPATPATPPPPAAPQEHWGRRAGRRLRNFVLLTLLLAAVLAGLYTWLALNWSYSTGERAGYVQKFSKKGWFCKTWEGEVAMVALPGAMPEMFPFTVRDDAVAAQINAMLGERIVATYDYHLPLPSCFGDTRYWVKSVRRVGQ